MDVHGWLRDARARIEKLEARVSVLEAEKANPFPMGFEVTGDQLEVIKRRGRPPKERVE
jgi:BMFP domain-containing protein YqiC